MVHFDVPPEISQAAMEQTEELSIAEASKVLFDSAGLK